jgi:REP element-mobilizing transposase RayT
MPEHVHLLVNEPDRGALSQMLQSLKQSVARTLALRAADSLWQARYLRLQRVERTQICGEAALHSSRGTPKSKLKG